MRFTTSIVAENREVKPFCSMRTETHSPLSEIWNPCRGTGEGSSEKCTGRAHDPPPQKVKRGDYMAKEKTVEQRVNTEKKRLSKLYTDLDPSQKAIATGLIERAAFMRVQCEDLEKDLTANGWVEKFSQGNQEPYDRARPQGQTYNTLNANYQKIIKQLDSMLPPPPPKEEKGDGFDDFINSRDEE